MYLAVDIGGTKTLLASFSKGGKLAKKHKFPTPQDYQEFLETLKKELPKLEVEDFLAAGVAVPGRLNRNEGLLIRLGNLPWENEPIQADIERITNCPVKIENDANLAALSEAQLIINDYKKVLYVTISTGIGTGITINGILDPSFIDSEGGQIILGHNGKLQTWEKFSSGKAIHKKYGKLASEINDPKIWKTISRDIAVGLWANIVTIQPDAVVLGGGVSTNFNKFKAPLLEELKKYETPVVLVPPILKAQRPEEAVVYGCYELIKEHYAKVAETVAK